MGSSHNGSPVNYRKYATIYRIEQDLFVPLSHMLIRARFFPRVFSNDISTQFCIVIAKAFVPLRSFQQHRTDLSILYDLLMTSNDMLAIHSRQYSGLFSLPAQIIFPLKVPIAPGRSA